MLGHLRALALRQRQRRLHCEALRALPRRSVRGDRMRVEEVPRQIESPEVDVHHHPGRQERPGHAELRALREVGGPVAGPQRLVGSPGCEVSPGRVDEHPEGARRRLPVRGKGQRVRQGLPRSLAVPHPAEQHAEVGEDGARGGRIERSRGRGPRLLGPAQSLDVVALGPHDLRRGRARPGPVPCGLRQRSRCARTPGRPAWPPRRHRNRGQTGPAAGARSRGRCRSPPLRGPRPACWPRLRRRPRPRAAPGRATKRSPPPRMLPRRHGRGRHGPRRERAGAGRGGRAAARPG